jgi:hypothetical protein
MRFLVLVVFAAATGALTVGAAVRVVGSDAAQFRLSDLNPIRLAYEEVKTKIASPTASPIFPSSPPIAFTPFKLPPSVEIDQKAISRAIAAGINSQVQQNYQRTQAMIQYGRNPMAWHGPPPH